MAGPETVERQGFFRRGDLRPRAEIFGGENPFRQSGEIIMEPFLFDIHADFPGGAEGDEHPLSRVRNVEVQRGTAGLGRYERLAAGVCADDEGFRWPAQTGAQQPAEKAAAGQVALSIFETVETSEARMFVRRQPRVELLLHGGVRGGTRQP